MLEARLVGQVLGEGSAHAHDALFIAAIVVVVAADLAELYTEICALRVSLKISVSLQKKEPSKFDASSDCSTGLPRRICGTNDIL